MSRSRPWLAPTLVALFISVPLLEVWLLTAVSSRIGVLPTIGILVVEALIGGWLMRREGSKAWAALSDAFGTGRMPSGELADAALVLVGGVLLMLPGFFTDVVGLLFLLPVTRPLARRLIGFVIAKQAARSGVDLGVIRATFEPETVIRGETVAENDTRKPPDPDDGRTIAGEIAP